MRLTFSSSSLSQTPTSYRNLLFESDKTVHKAQKEQDRKLLVNPINYLIPRKEKKREEKKKGIIIMILWHLILVLNIANCNSLFNILCKIMIVVKQNYQNRLVGWPGISAQLLPRTLNSLRLYNDLGAISIPTNKIFFLTTNSHNFWEFSQIPVNIIVSQENKKTHI